MIGEGFEAELSEDIAGLVLSTRRQADRISMWTKTSADERLQKRIGYVRPFGLATPVSFRCGGSRLCLGHATRRGWPLACFGGCWTVCLSAGVLLIWGFVACIVVLVCSVQCPNLWFGAPLFFLWRRAVLAFSYDCSSPHGWVVLLGRLPHPPRPFFPPSVALFFLHLGCCREAWRATATPTGLHDNVQLEYLIHKDSIAKNSSYKNKPRFFV